MGADLDHFAEVVSLIRAHGTPAIPVPRLSNLLGVKATTLNARFRRLHIAVQTVGRVNFVPVALAVELAGLHKYALLGWPTVQQASRLTAVKGCTIKAKCEKRQVEGYRDLTKRLRINPAAIEALRPSKPGIQNRERHNGGTHSGVTRAAPPEAKVELPRQRVIPAKKPARPTSCAGRQPGVQHPEPSRPAAKPFVLPPARDLEVKFITASDYGLPESDLKSEARHPRVPGNNLKAPGLLYYDPDRPVSLSECAVGKSIRYGEYNGTIVGILDEPFSPKIKVRFPEHRHPLMQEVLLVVDKRRN